MGPRTVLLCLCLASRVSAMNFVLPLNGANWTTSGPNSIAWTYKQGDPASINIQLLHDNSSAFEPIPELLPADGTFATGIDITTRQMFFTPSCIPGKPSLPTGSGFSLRMYSEQTDGNRTTLGTMNGTFNIIPGDDRSLKPCPQLETSRNHAGAIAGGVVGGLAACFLVVLVTVMYSRYRRTLRKRMTQQFVMKKGLVLAKPSEDVEMK